MQIRENRRKTMQLQEIREDTRSIRQQLSQAKNLDLETKQSRYKSVNSFDYDYKFSQSSLFFAKRAVDQNRTCKAQDVTLFKHEHEFELERLRRSRRL